MICNRCRRDIQEATVLMQRVRWVNLVWNGSQYLKVKRGRESWCSACTSSFKEWYDGGARR
jgi:hypothetical protein